jgi:hypothetical protein
MQTLQGCLRGPASSPHGPCMLQAQACRCTRLTGPAHRSTQPCGAYCTCGGDKAAHGDPQGPHVLSATAQHATQPRRRATAAEAAWPLTTTFPTGCSCCVLLPGTGRTGAHISAACSMCTWSTKLSPLLACQAHLLPLACVAAGHACQHAAGPTCMDNCTTGARQATYHTGNHPHTRSQYPVGPL